MNDFSFKRKSNPQSMNDERIKTHSLTDNDLEEVLKKLKNKICANEKNSLNFVKEQFAILDDLASFPLGQHILLNGGANGAWTDYLISPQECLGDDLRYDCSLIESFFLFHSPAVIAQRELIRLSQKIAQSQLSEGKKFASIPCGVMRDLLSLDFSSVKDISLVGIDIDPLSLNLASQLALKLNVRNVSFIEKDAWNLDYESEFDFINSIGLNVYESDRKAVIALYNQFYKALKPNGILFTGVLTWPPYIDGDKSEWVIDNIPNFDLYLEEIIHKYILDLKWLNFRMLNEVESDFIQAGFSKVAIHKDPCCIFPAIVATK